MARHDDGDPSPDCSTHVWLILKLQRRLGRNEKDTRGYYLPALNKVLETVAPMDASCRFVLKLGNRLAHDIGEQVDETSSGLHLGAVGWEGEAMLCNLQQGNTR